MPKNNVYIDIPPDQIGPIILYENHCMAGLSERALPLIH